MKFLAKIILFLFVTFLSTPTIVSLIEDMTDSTILFDFAEEETIKKSNEIKADLKHSYYFSFFKTALNNSLIIISENLSKHDNVTEEIFSPPPEII